MFEIDQTISHCGCTGKIDGGGISVFYKTMDMELSRFMELEFLTDAVSRHRQVVRRFPGKANSFLASKHLNICMGLDSIEYKDSTLHCRGISQKPGPQAAYRRKTPIRMASLIQSSA
jgi:hypothetical protein